MQSCGVGARAEAYTTAHESSRHARLSIFLVLCSALVMTTAFHNLNNFFGINLLPYIIRRMWLGNNNSLRDIKMDKSTLKTPNYYVIGCT